MSVCLPCHWQDLTSQEVAHLPDDTVAMIVLGAIEQHGAHLPLSTDLDIGVGLLDVACRTLADGFPLVTLPPLAVGASEEHCSFAGTVSLPSETVISILECHGAALARAGVERLVMSNAHGGNDAAMDIAALRLRQRHGMLVVKYHYLRSPLPELPVASLPAGELRHGIHGGAVETAIMRHLYPQRVRTDQLDRHASSGERAEAAGELLGPEGEGSIAWLAEDLHPDGVVGDARLGTSELGERLVRHYADRLVRMLHETRARSLPNSPDHS